MSSVPRRLASPGRCPTTWTRTLPAQLRPLARQHQRLFYHLLFRASAAATQQLARDPRFIGGPIGLVGVLHTWTRDLQFHPHVHYLAPAGGLAADGQTWLPARKNFFLPVKALSRLFRRHFQRALQKVADAPSVPECVWHRDWVVHCKPVGTGETALKYLAPYIFRVALSNRRLVNLDATRDQVTFRYTQSKTSQTKYCTLPADQFIHRVLQHVLPRGFVKVRYFGLFSRKFHQPLTILQQHLRQSQAPVAPASPAASGAVQHATPSSLPQPTDHTMRCPDCWPADAPAADPTTGRPLPTLTSLTGGLPEAC